MRDRPSRRTMMAAVLSAAIAPAALVAPVRAAEPVAHDFDFAGIDGDTLRMAAWRGRPVLVVNTASRCGFTDQYTGLQALHDTYRDRGLVVLGVPSDDFGGQELATEKEVKDFCAVNFAIDFPMTAITRVRGRDAHPFYAWAAGAGGQAGGSPGLPRWNFHKILIGPDGRLVAGFPSRVEPMSRQIRDRIEALLPGDGPQRP